jgi:hypothetical protein
MRAWLVVLLLAGCAGAPTPRPESFDIWLEGSQSWGTYREGPSGHPKPSTSAGHDRHYGVSGGVTFHFSLERRERSAE